jgi:hypothetical protein
MNQDLNKVKLPKGASHKGKEILKILNVVVGEKDSESGYMAVNEDGDRVFIKNSEMAKLSEPQTSSTDESEGE